MTYDCELIQDLLPLYEEGICSPTSRKAVEAHLKECKICRRLTVPLPIENPKEIPAADKAVKKSIKKARRSWLTSLVAALLVFPVMLMAFNQHRGVGLSFTNLDDILTACGYLSDLQNQDWESMAAGYDFEPNYNSIMDVLGLTPEEFTALSPDSQTAVNAARSVYAPVADMSLEEFDHYMTERYLLELEELESLDFQLEGVHYRSVLSFANEGYEVAFTGNLHSSLGNAPAHITVCVENGKLRHLSLTCEDLSELTDTIDRALYPSAHPDY